MNASSALEGGCICGAVRYRVRQAQVVMMCHCRNCQQRTGSAYSLAMLTLRPDFEVLSGETLSRDLPGGSGELCPRCLTGTHTEMLAYPDIINVRPGTLDDPSSAKPIAQVWTSVAHLWAIAPGIQVFEENPVDVPALAQAWRAAHDATPQ